MRVTTGKVRVGFVALVLLLTARSSVASANAKPIAHAGPEQIGAVNAPVTFDASGSSATGGRIVTYWWIFGDGTSVETSTPIVSHAYAAEAWHLVSLWVLDDRGRWSSGPDTALVAIGAGPTTAASLAATAPPESMAASAIMAADGTAAALPPRADAGPDQAVSARVPLVLAGAGVAASGRRVVAYRWSFGDGFIGDGARARHAYAAPGTFTATLTVTDDTGAVARDSAVVTVAAAAEATRTESNRANDVRVVTGAAGDAVTGGSFRGTIALDRTTLTSAGGTDWFLAKIDGGGTALWTRRFGGTLDDTLTAVAIDAHGDVLAVGRFDGSASFGGITLVSAGSSDVAIAKYDGRTGAHLWSRRFGDAADQSAEAVAVDAGGDVLVTGYFAGGVDFGTGTIRTPSAGYDVFVARLTSAGTTAWARGFAGTGNELGTTVGVDAGGNVAFTGFFDDTVDFGGPTLVAAVQPDAFLVTLSPGGMHLSSAALGDTDPATGTAPADGR